MKRLFVCLALLGLLALPSLSDAGIFRRSCGTSYASYPTVSYPAYTAPYVAPAYTPPAVVAPAYTADWKTEVLKYAEKRDDLQLYERTIQALGITAPGLNYQSYGASGATQYGYTYQSIQQAYGELNLNTLYQQAARLTQGAQDLGGQATTEFAGLVGQAGQNQARVAEILAKSQAAVSVLKAAEASPSTTTVTTVQGQAGQAARLANDPATVAWQTSAKQCAGCHSGGNAKGGFDVASYPSLPTARKLNVISRLTTADPVKLMPRKADGTPGAALSLTELQLWLALVQ